MVPRLRSCVVLVALAALVPAPRAWSQGFVIEIEPGGRVAVPRPSPRPRPYEIREVTVDARLREQVAEVRVSQTFHNPGSVVLESEYLFPLPDDGAIQNFVLMVDGKELPGRVLPKDEARRVYESIVRSQRDPALLEYMGRGLFRTSVFPIPPGADRKVTLTYTQLCRRDRDVVEFAYPFATQKFTARPIRRLRLDLEIESKDPIKSVYSPTTETTIERDGEHRTRVHFEQHQVVPSGDFRLVYTLAEGAVGASVLSYRPSASEDGYFLLLASPRVKADDTEPRPKTVVFVLDRSGSMAGKKIVQARKALRFVLDNLREDDLFNIVVYDDRVETFQPELQRYSSRTRREAERYVDNIREGGATNIDAALRSALGLVRDEERPAYVLFLTDGLPTAGETGEQPIARACREANARHARVFAFGVGYDVNARLLDRISGGNGGTSEYVKPDEDIETHVARFYGRLTSPVLTRPRIELEGTDVNRTYPAELPDLFEGGQLVWVGRYRESGPATVRLTGKVGSERRTFEFPAELAEPGRGRGHEFVERLWAVRRVGHIIDRLDLLGRNKELIDELVALSTRYGILTPYTSFLADDRVHLHARAENARQAGESLRELEVVSGGMGVAQRSVKQQLAAAERAEPLVTLGTDRYQTHLQDGAVAASPAASAPAVAKSTRRPASAAAGPARPAMVVQDASGKPSAVSTVRQVGAKTFYFKQGRWVDSQVTPERARQATVIAQFSDAYFRLARSQDAELNRYLAFDEPLIVDLGGTVYQIEPATQ